VQRVGPHGGGVPDEIAGQSGLPDDTPDLFEQAETESAPAPGAQDGGRAEG
jgi:hypothetical protein